MKHLPMVAFVYLNIFINTSEVVIFLLYKNSECFYQCNFLAVTKAQKFLKNILDTHIVRILVTSLNIFYLPNFFLKY